VIDGAHIPLSVKPNQQITSYIADFFNRKHCHSIMLQAMCDCDMFFWNACIAQLGGVVNKGQFKMSSLYFFFDQDKFCKNKLLLLKVCKFNLTYLGM